MKDIILCCLFILVLSYITADIVWAAMDYHARIATSHCPRHESGHYIGRFKKDCYEQETS